MNMVAAKEIVQPQVELAEYRPVAQFVEKDELMCLRTERFIRSIGAGPVARVVEAADGIKKEASKFPTLMDAVIAAQTGDHEARKVVEGNACSQALECLFKWGIVLEVPLEVDEKGRLKQHGQLLRDVYKNALLYASATSAIRERTCAEIGNGFLMEYLVARGRIDGSASGQGPMGRKEESGHKENFVVISRPPEDMSEEEMKRAGFFTDTMSCAIQVIRMKQGKLVQESAFVAELFSPNGTRHGRQTIEKMLAKLGVNAAGMTVTELLGRPLLVDESVMPNGVVDLVKLYDEAAGGTFFGRTVQRQDYASYLEVMQQRFAELDAMVQQIVALVIARANEVHDPVDAINLLHDVAQDCMVELALQDDRIDTHVFREGAQYIEAGRRHLAQGNMMEFQKARQAALATSSTSSCPMAVHELGASSDKGIDPTQIDGQVSAAEGVGKIGYDACRTPNCPSAGRKTVVGECRVCLLYCQPLWNRGIDPGTVYRPRHRDKTPVDMLMESIQALLATREHAKQKEAALQAGKLAMAA